MSVPKINPDPDYTAMTPGQRFEYVVNRLNYLQGQLDQQHRNLEGLRRTVGELRSEMSKGPAAKYLINRMHLGQPTPPAPALSGSPPTAGAGASEKA